MKTRIFLIVMVLSLMSCGTGTDVYKNTQSTVIATYSLQVGHLGEIPLVQRGDGKWYDMNDVVVADTGILRGSPIFEVREEGSKKILGVDVSYSTSDGIVVQGGKRLGEKEPIISAGGWLAVSETWVKSQGDKVLVFTKIGIKPYSAAGSTTTLYAVIKAYWLPMK